MSDLVTRLCDGQHPVEISLRPERTPQAFKECVDRGYVHVKFPNTRGGTELGVRVDMAKSDFSHADFDLAQGRLTLVGDLTLDYVKVRCIADIGLPALEGTGRLELADQAAQQ